MSPPPHALLPPGPLTEDALLGGRVRLRQPAQGYRAAIDPVLLAAAVPARPGERVLEAGLGAGAAALCLLARVAGARVTGIERDHGLAALAAANATANGWAARLAVVVGAIAAGRAGESLRRRLAGLEPFDHAMANPPQQRADAGTASPRAGRRAADREEEAAPLAAWVAVLARRLRPGGSLTLVHRADRLAEAMAALQASKLGGLALLPIWPRAGEPARRLILQGIKGSRAPGTLLAGLTLHEATGPAYTDAAGAVLRAGAPLVLRAERSRRRNVD